MMDTYEHGNKRSSSCGDETTVNSDIFMNRTPRGDGGCGNNSITTNFINKNYITLDNMINNCGFMFPPNMKQNIMVDQKNLVDFQNRIFKID